MLDQKKITVDLATMKIWKRRKNKGEKQRILKSRL